MFWDPSALSLAAGLAGAKAEFAKCSGCKVLESYLMDSSLGVDPTKESADIRRSCKSMAATCSTY